MHQKLITTFLWSIAHFRNQFEYSQSGTQLASVQHTHTSEHQQCSTRNRECKCDQKATQRRGCSHGRHSWDRSHLLPMRNRLKRLHWVRAATRYNFCVKTRLLLTTMNRTLGLVAIVAVVKREGKPAIGRVISSRLGTISVIDETKISIISRVGVVAAIVVWHITFAVIVVLPVFWAATVGCRKATTCLVSISLAGCDN